MPPNTPRARLPVVVSVVCAIIALLSLLLNWRLGVYHRERVDGLEAEIDILKRTSHSRNAAPASSNSVSASQEQSARTSLSFTPEDVLKPWTSPAVYWKLNLSVRADESEPNVLVGSLQNVSGEAQLLRVSAPPTGWKITLTAKGKEPMTKDAADPFGVRSGNTLVIGVGEVRSERFALNKLFELTPGVAYEVVVSCTLADLGAAGTDISRFTVSSGPLAFVARY